jgi:hypothetical protein
MTGRESFGGDFEMETPDFAPARLWLVDGSVAHYVQYRRAEDLLASSNLRNFMIAPAVATLFLR